MELSYLGCAVVCEAKANMLLQRRIASGPGHLRWQMRLRAERHLRGHAEACRQAAARLEQERKQ